MNCPFFGTCFKQYRADLTEKISFSTHQGFSRSQQKLTPNSLPVVLSIQSWALIMMVLPQVTIVVFAYYLPK